MKGGKGGKTLKVAGKIVKKGKGKVKMIKGKKVLVGKKGGKRKPTSDALDKELEAYWIKKGEKKTVEDHLDNEMDEYWKSQKEQSSNVEMAKNVGKNAASVMASNEATKMTSSNDGSMLLSMQDMQAKDLTGASPHYQSGLNLISN